MKKYLLFSLTLSLFILMNTTASAVRHITIYGDDGYAPYSFKDNEKNNGIYVKILQKAFSKMKRYKVEIKLIPWKRAILLTKKGAIFAIFPPYFRPNRRPWIEPYSVPILDEGLSVYCRNEVLTPSRPNWPEDYKGLQIGINDGFLIPDAEELQIQDAPSNKINLKKLFAGRIDCYVNDSKSILYTVKQMGADISMIKEGAQLSLEHGYLAFSKNNNPPYKQDFIEKFNTVIMHMKQSGEIEKIVHDFLYE